MLFKMEASPVELGNCFALLPQDILLSIVEKSDYPLHTYMQLLGLSHAIRLAVRGIPREISFDDELSFENDRQLALAFTRPTADALAALLGPCKSLAKLSFRSSECPFYPNVYGCGGTEAACAGWVDEAFGGHDRLAVLEYLPTNVESVIERILLRLPGLLELRLNSQLPLSAHLLSAIARSCPHLQSLRSNAATVDINALAPLAGSMQHLGIRPVDSAPTSSDAFVSSLSAVGTLRLGGRCRPAALEPLAAHLTRLSLVMDQENKGEDLPGPWLCRLERLTLRGCRFSSPPPPPWTTLSRLLVANQATLQRLKLEITRPDAPGLARFMGVLDSLTRLTHLNLTCISLPHDAVITTALPPALLDRLESLTISLLSPEIHTVPRLCLTSSRLRHLDLQKMRLEALDLECPALVDLWLPPHLGKRQLSVRCPRLRLVKGMPAYAKGFREPLPDLELVDVQELGRDPLWLPHVVAGSPRLRSIRVPLSQPGLLALLCASGSLVDMALELTRMSNPLVLRLPGQLTHLRLSLNDTGTPFDLLVEAMGLRHLDITSSLGTWLKSRLGCPVLETLCARFRGPDDAAREFGGDLTLDDRTQLRSLHIEGYWEAASLLDVLTRHGARLHHVKLPAPSVAASDWPQVAAALGGLPRLANLELDITNAPSPLSLACPQLRSLRLDDGVGGKRVVLACPLLERRFGGISSAQVVLAVPTSDLLSL
ncbi:hypothetical protein PAPYR_486 [Paratrimastix pyriformis]|uniref:Uncharacterized protein n=1 Tax=Paratrimastix pyriformis TaxID=342808 RepID=A0ABQ8UYP9_9EUKA|nr:hypothetical protein PAPYR_486 [Paratrimastix pyriformis]